mgnify:CR=1 FL=1
MCLQAKRREEEADERDRARLRQKKSLECPLGIKMKLRPYLSLLQPADKIMCCVFIVLAGQEAREGG